MSRTVILAAHGSRDPRAGATVRALARAVGAGRGGWHVRAGFLELTEPHLSAVLAECRERPVVVVPLLLTPAYHARTDLPGIAATARAGGARVEVTDVLGPDTGRAVPDELIAAVRGRLARSAPDALVLAAAGSRDPAALASVEAVAAALGAAVGRPCLPGYVTGLGEPIGVAVDRLRTAGARTVALSSYFLAPGLLHDRAVDAATESAVAAVAPPLGAHPDLVALVRRRVREARGRSTPEPALAVAA